MNSESFDLIYLDPPFNSNHNYAAPIGSKAAGSAFKDTWGLNDLNLAWHGLIKYDYPALYDLLKAVQGVHSDSMMSYLIYMAVRVMEMKRLLKSTGSIYLHCDPTASHYLKLLMDCVFGKENFRNEIYWKRDASGKGGKRVSRQWPRVNDVLFFYSNSNSYKFEQQYGDLSDKAKANYRIKDEATERLYKAVQLGNYSKESVRKFESQGLIHTSRTGKKYKKYYMDEAKTTIDNLWADIPGFGVRTNARERTGYPTQKPRDLLERIIKAASNKDDMVLDPFCGCATACIAAEILDRQWVGIDISEKAADLVKSRLYEEVGQLLFHGLHRKDIPDRTDLGKVPKYNSPENKKYLYGEQGGHCNACKGFFEIRQFDVDHIIPKSKGGTDHISNLQLLCGNCNKIKGTGNQDELLARLLDKGYIKTITKGISVESSMSL